MRTFQYALCILFAATLSSCSFSYKSTKESDSVQTGSSAHTHGKTRKIKEISHIQAF